MYDYDRIRKSNEDLIEDLTHDTFERKLRWYGDDSMDYYYCRRRVIKNDISNIKDDKDKIDIIFKISESLVDEEEDDVPYQFQAYYESYPSISLEIYMSKNGKKEIFCKRIMDHQLKLVELLSTVVHNSEKKPKK